jgi:hypothetical protein
LLSRWFLGLIEGVGAIPLSAHAAHVQLAIEGRSFVECGPSQPMRTSKLSRHRLLLMWRRVGLVSSALVVVLLLIVLVLLLVRHIVWGPSPKGPSAL